MKYLHIAAPNQVKYIIVSYKKEKEKEKDYWLFFISFLYLVRIL